MPRASVSVVCACLCGRHAPSDSLTGYLIHTDVSLIGSIEFSDSLMNSIQSAVHWGQRCNILSLPTDCPQRDERKVVRRTDTQHATHRHRHEPLFPPPSL